MFYFYRPQTKFAKVMFLHVSVCPQGGVPVHPLGSGTPTGPGTPPRTRYTPWDQEHSPSYGPGTLPNDQVHPSGSGTPPTRNTPPGLGTVHAGRYGQQAGGTHPTGMHSCFVLHFSPFCGPLRFPTYVMYWSVCFQ